MAEYTRAHAIVRGIVQGVFFRMETKRAAERIGVVGWVRNRPEGTVEAVFEGKKEAVEAAIKWCWEGSPAARVDDVAVTWEEFQGEFSRFEITR